MIRLFTSMYPEKNPGRQAELAECLRRNLACGVIDEICLLVERGNVVIPGSGKIRTRSIGPRPRYSDFFDWINEVAQGNDISLVANSDIWFDGNLRVLDCVDFSGNLVMALSRWDCLPDGTCRIFDVGDSQDCWILHGTVRGVKGDFPLGVYDCDNKIAWEFEQGGYRVMNPSFSLRTYHLHLGAERSYDPAAPADHGIRPPFRYVEPDNLWGPLRAWRVMRRMRLSYYPWLMTGRRFWRYPGPAIVMRVWNRLRRELRRCEVDPKIRPRSGRLKL